MALPALRISVVFSGLMTSRRTAVRLALPQSLFHAVDSVVAAPHKLVGFSFGQQAQHLNISDCDLLIHSVVEDEVPERMREKTVFCDVFECFGFEQQSG